MCADSMTGDDMRMAMSMCLNWADMAGACADECLKHADAMPSMAMRSGLP